MRWLDRGAAGRRGRGAASRPIGGATSSTTPRPRSQGQVDSTWSEAAVSTYPKAGDAIRDGTWSGRRNTSTSSSTKRRSSSGPSRPDPGCDRVPRGSRPDPCAAPRTEPRSSVDPPARLRPFVARMRWREFQAEVRAFTEACGAGPGVVHSRAGTLKETWRQIQDRTWTTCTGSSTRLRYWRAGGRRVSGRVIGPLFTSRYEKSMWSRNPWDESLWDQLYLPSRRFAATSSGPTRDGNMEFTRTTSATRGASTPAGAAADPCAATPSRARPHGWNHHSSTG